MLKDGVYNAEPLKELYKAAVECQEKGCDKATAATILDKWTVKESFIDNFVVQKLTGNWDQALNMLCIQADPASKECRLPTGLGT